MSNNLHETFSAFTQTKIILTETLLSPDKNSTESDHTNKKEKTTHKLSNTQLKSTKSISTKNFKNRNGNQKRIKIGTLPQKQKISIDAITFSTNILQLDTKKNLIIST
ncbi:hypothetical protein ACOSP7_006834 [Xanthoceras sorbifolium]